MRDTLQGMARKRPKTEKLSVNLRKGGELRYETAYDAPEAARIAASWAKKGWAAEVQAWQSLGTRRNVYMTCRGSSAAFKRHGRSDKLFAKCEMKPAFKRRVKRA